MGALTLTQVANTPLANKRLWVGTATLAAASDTATLSLASHGVRTIYAAWAILEGGADAALLAGLQVSFSGLVITIVSLEQDGTPSTDWAGANVRICAIVD